MVNPNDDFIHDLPTAATPKTTSNMDTPADTSPENQGGGPPPFSLAQGSEGGKAAASAGPSPMEVNADMATNPFSAQQNLSTQSLEQQASAISNQFDKAKGLLQDPAVAQNNNLIKAATTDLLSQHLSRVNDNMTALSSKIGTPLTTTYTPPSSGTQAVAHFLDYLTGGQQDLANLTSNLQTKAGKMSPADLLTVQLKMSGVQQQMEFFSVLLGKAVDNIKTIMNIQS